MYRASRILGISGGVAAAAATIAPQKGELLRTADRNCGLSTVGKEKGKKKEKAFNTSTRVVILQTLVQTGTRPSHRLNADPSTDRF